MVSHVFFVLCVLPLLLSWAASDNVVVFSQNGDRSLHTREEAAAAATEVATVSVNLQQVINEISPYFIGVTIDSQQIRYDWNELDFSSAKVVNMALALTPSYLRLGGTAADYMTYDLGNNSVYKGDNFKGGKVGCSNFLTQFSMTADQWEKLMTFVSTADWDFIMDLNALKRLPDGSWDPENARQLLQHSEARDYVIAGFELGNEYDLYLTPVSPTQFAKDYASLQRLLVEFPGSYYSSFIVGPEVSGVRGQEYFQGFLQAGGSQHVRASSFHHYYFSGKESSLADFTNVTVMDRLVASLDSQLTQTRAVDPQLPVWLSETSSASQCGTPNISDRFVAGFLWLDKLGLSAAKGIQTVIRQDFYGFNYGLLDLDLNPNPDFWLTVVFKRVVRGSVFNVTIDRTDVRAYAACATFDKDLAVGGVVVYFINANDYSVDLNLGVFTAQPKWIYSLTAGDSTGLLSKFTALNGVRLQLNGDTVPETKPRVVKGSVPVTLEPYSMTFVCMPEARVDLCLE